MREIQTEIRRDRIENENSRDTPQNRVQSGIKTKSKSKEKVEKAAEAENDNGKTINTEAKKSASRTTETATEDAPEAEKAVEAIAQNHSHEAVQTPAEIQSENPAPPPASVTTATSTKTDNKEIQTQIKRDSIQNSVSHDNLQNKAQSGIKTRSKPEDNTDKAAEAEGDNEKTVDSVVKNKAPKTASKSPLPTAANKPSTSATSQSPSDNSPDDIEADNKTQSPTVQPTPTQSSSNSIKNRVNHSTPQSSIRTQKAQKSKLTKSPQQAKKQAMARIGKALKGTVAFGANATVFTASSASKLLQSTIPDGDGDDLTSETAGKVKQEAGEITDKSLNAIKTITKKKADFVKKRRAKKQNPKVSKSKAAEIKNKALNKIRKGSKIIGKAVKPVTKITGSIGSLGGTAQRLGSYAGDSDIGKDLAEVSKSVAEKAVQTGFNVSKRTVGTAKKPVKAVYRKIKNISKRTVKTGVKVSTKKAIKTGAKVSAKATQRTIKTSVKAARTAVKVTKAAARAAAYAIKAAAQAARVAVQTTVTVIRTVVQAIAALMSTPVGWVIAIVVLVVVLIVVIFNAVSGAVAPVSAVGGAGSSLSWLFGDNATEEEIAEIYDGFKETTEAAMADARSYYKARLNSEIVTGRDTIKLNGASFYPTSAADEYVQNFFDCIDYGNCNYLLELCYIKKLREERANNNISDTEMPQIDISKDDVYSLLVSYCYNFNITVTHGQSCPSADCRQSNPPVTYCGGYCNPKDDGSPGECPGHSAPSVRYCDHSHALIDITITEKSKDIIESELALTEEEKQILEMALAILDEYTG